MYVCEDICVLLVYVCCFVFAVCENVCLVYCGSVCVFLVSMFFVFEVCENVCFVYCVYYGVCSV